MKTFKEFVSEHLISETFINLLPHHIEKKRQHAEEVFNMLQNSYKKIGGIHGDGFKSPEDMVNNMKMWKLYKKNGKIVSASMYKDKKGRKRVASATDGSEEGKTGLARIVADDLKHKRSYGEISGPMLKFTRKQVPDLQKHVIPYDQVQNLAGEEIRRPPEDDEELKSHPDLAHHFYQRKIGGEWHTKIMVGHPGNEIT